MRTWILGALLPLVVAAPVEARVLGLSIGVNDYVSLENLKGAAADALDVSDALRRAGASPVFVLRDAEATRDAVTDAWDRLMEVAAPGDTLVLHFSGHGVQEPELVSGDEADGLDESFALARFEPAAQEGRRERLVDNELFAWFAEANRRGVKVVFVADTCHSGGLLRSSGSRPKLAPPVQVSLPSPSPEAASSAELEESGLDALLVLSASLEAELAYEVKIAGQDTDRGALSYAFARAIEGNADNNGDGAIDRLELERYVLARVRQLSDALHTPDARPRGGANLSLFGATPSSDQSSSPPLLRVPAGSPLATLPGVTPSEDALDLAINASGDLVNGNGEIVSTAPSVFDLEQSVEKYRLLAWLQARAERAPLPISLDPDDATKRVGERFYADIAAEHRTHPFILAFNLNNRGGVDHLYPYHPHERHERPITKHWAFEILMTPPTGADHLVVIAANQRLDTVVARLKDSPTAAALLRDLPALLDGVRTEIAIQAVFTEG